MYCTHVFLHIHLLFFFNRRHLLRLHTDAQAHAHAHARARTHAHAYGHAHTHTHALKEKQAYARARTRRYGYRSVLLLTDEPHVAREAKALGSVAGAALLVSSESGAALLVEVFDNVPMPAFEILNWEIAVARVCNVRKQRRDTSSEVEAIFPWHKRSSL
eukprot:6188344-Pleurochrysis_carterae.AAC.3